MRVTAGKSGVLERAARQPRQPSTPTNVPIISDATVSTTWTIRNAVGPLSNDRSSFQILRKKVGQMIQLHTPTARRNALHRRDSTTNASLTCRATGANLD